MTIVIGSIKQETNTFSKVSTTLNSFSNGYLYEGESVIQKLGGTRTEVGGFLNVIKQNNKITIPTIAASSISGGIVTKESYELLKNKLLNFSVHSEKIEGVLLSLHGAMVAENCNDTEGEIISYVREKVGSAVPIAVSLDPHANVTQLMLDSADIIVSYKTFPHIDQFETGVETAKLLMKMLNNQYELQMQCIRIPMITSPEAHIDNASPMVDILNSCREVENYEDIFSVSFCPVQPWLDIPNIATTINVVAKKEHSEKARRIIERIAETIWDKKNQFIPTRYHPDKAIEKAIKNFNGKPYILSESADSMIAGAPGDGVYLLKALLKKNLQYSSLITIADPHVVNEATKKGIGNKIKVDLGHALDNDIGSPVTVDGEVYNITNGKFILQSTGVKESMGKTAVIKVKKIYIVVCSNAFFHQDPNSYNSVGLDIRESIIVGVKSTLHFRHFYSNFAQEIMLVDVPGVSNGQFTKFNWKCLKTPVWPLNTVKFY